MSYSWFRFDVDAGDDPKYALLDHQLGERNTLAYAARAGCWLMRYAARGVWAPELDAAFESACGWRGDAGRLVRAMTACGLVEVDDSGQREWHDWWQKQGKAVEKAEKDALVKRNNRRAKKGLGPETQEGRPKKGAKTARAAPAPGAQTALLRDVTERDETEHDLSTPPPSLDANGATKAQGELAQLRDAIEGAGEIAKAFASVWLMWACTNGATEKPGQLAYARTVYWFQKYAGDSPGDAETLNEQLKLAWLDFIEHCEANGHTPGWGLWLEEKVGQFRLDEARNGLLPRNGEPYKQTPMPLGVLGSVRT